MVRIDCPQLSGFCQDRVETETMTKRTELDFDPSPIEMNSAPEGFSHA
jgi:hypothetical protein